MLRLTFVCTFTCTCSLTAAIHSESHLNSSPRSYAWCRYDFLNVTSTPAVTFIKFCQNHCVVNCDPLYLLLLCHSFNPLAVFECPVIWNGSFLWCYVLIFATCFFLLNHVGGIVNFFPVPLYFSHYIIIIIIINCTQSTHVIKRTICQPNNRFSGPLVQHNC